MWWSEWSRQMMRLMTMARTDVQVCQSSMDVRGSCTMFMRTRCRGP